MFGTIIRYAAKKPKPKMKPIELKMPPEQTQTITRVIFDIVKEHGPLTIADTRDHVKEVGVRGLTSKRHMKIILRWVRERQTLRLNLQSCRTPEAIFVYNLVHKAQHSADEECEWFSTTKTITKFTV